MPIENIRRFHCPRCDYMTEDAGQIEMIEKLGGKCPACHDGKPRVWSHTLKDAVAARNRGLGA
jgi:hypothetical protein